MDTSAHTQCNRDAPACPCSFGCRMRTHRLNCRAKTLCWLCGIPAVLGHWESNTRRLRKYHIFCLNKPGLTNSHSCFLLRSQRGQSLCEAWFQSSALPVYRGFPLGRDHSALRGALSTRISLFSMAIVMQVTFRNQLSFWVFFWAGQVFLSPQSHPSSSRSDQKYYEVFLRVFLFVGFFWGGLVWVFCLSLLLFLSPPPWLTNS